MGEIKREIIGENIGDRYRGMMEGILLSPPITFPIIHELVALVALQLQAIVFPLYSHQI